MLFEWRGSGIELKLQGGTKLGNYHGIGLSDKLTTMAVALGANQIKWNVCLFSYGIVNDVVEVDSIQPEIQRMLFF